MRTLRLLVLLSCFPATATAAEFIGAENCRVCHPSAYQAWQQSQHARASEALSARQQQDRRCLSCHSPDQESGHKDVTCETCHGGGQHYAPSYVMKDSELARAVGLQDPTEKLCLKCHDANAPSIRPFKFAEKLKQIDHWTAEREARKLRRPDAKTGKGGSKR